VSGSAALAAPAVAGASAAGALLAGLPADLAVVLALLVGSAFYSGAETALVSASRARLETLAAEGRRDAARAIDLIERTPRTLATVLVGTNLCNIGASAFVTSLAVKISPEQGAALATVVLTPIVLFFGEILPKAFFRTRPTRILRYSSAVLRASGVLFAPLGALASGATELLLRLMRVPPEEARPAFRREDLETAFLFGSRPRPADEPSDPDESRSALWMAGKALFLAERTAVDAMVPLAPERTVPTGSSVAGARERFREAGGRYLAVVDGQGRVEGFVAAKNLLGEDPEAPIPVRPAWSIDPDDRLDEVIQSLRRSQQAIGVVRGRDGETRGILTAEDLFEEVVGELTAGGRSSEPSSAPGSARRN
jgi:CBS domain containing-hemolysin-like protein